MKKILSLVLALSLVLSLGITFTSCGNANDEKTIIVGASPTPHAEILEQAKSILAAKGYTLVIKEYSDYVLPNTALEDGELDANYFQHTPYMNSFNESEGTHLVSAGLIHYEPFGIYGNGITDLANLQDGATIIIPNDGSNETRALLLLQQEGLITLKAGVTAADKLTTLDIVSYKGNYVISEVDADMAPSQLRNSNAGTIAVINGNYAIGGGLKIADALAQEDASGEAAQTYANIIAVKEGNENSEKILALVEALQDAAIAAYMENTWKGAVVATH